MASIQDVKSRFAIGSDRVERWATRLYQHIRHEDDLRLAECNYCKIRSMLHNGAVSSEEEAVRGMLTALKREMELEGTGSLQFGVWYTNYGLAAYQVNDHIHIVPTIIDKLLLGALSPRAEKKPVTLPAQELPRKIRL